MINFFNSLDDKQKLLFIGSAYAKINNLKYVPRIVIEKNEKIKQRHLNHLFNEDFQNIDDKFWSIITNYDFLEPENNYIVLFDKTRMDFQAHDVIFEKTNNKLKEKFYLDKRHEEQMKFLKSNYNIVKRNSLVSEVLVEKLNDLWRFKWNNNQTYSDHYNYSLINSIHD